MKFLWITACIVYATFYPVKVQTQYNNYEIQKFSEEDGLNVNYITCIHQDKNGFIWMGSFFGLNRFDGQRITSISPNHKKSRSLHANFIFHINEDKSGLLWLCDEHGLTVFDPKTERAIQLNEHISQIPKEEFRKTIIDQQGRVWFYTLEKDGWQLHQLSINNNELKDYIQKAKSNFPKYKVTSTFIGDNISGKIHLFWHLNEEQILMCNDKSQFIIFNIFTQKFSPIAVTALTKPILNTDRSLLWSKKLNRGIIITPNHDYTNDYKFDQLSEVLPFKNQWVEFGFFSNQIKWLEKNVNDQFVYKDSIKLEYPTTFSRLVDHSGNIWLGTLGYGIYKINKQVPIFTKIGSEGHFYNFRVLPDKKLWPGYIDDAKVLNSVTGEITEDVPWKDKLPVDSKIKDVLWSSDKKYIYISGSVKNRENFFAQYDLYRKTIKIISKDIKYSGQSELVMKEAKDGSIWISGFKGELLRFMPDSEKLDKWDLKNLFPENIANKLQSRDMKQMESGDIWIANNFGLICIKSNDNDINFLSYHNYKKGEKLFINDGIFSMETDPFETSVLWLGTQGGGIASFDTKTETLKYYPNPEEEKVNFPATLTTDRFGNLWFASEKGIKCFSTVKKEYIHFFGEQKLKFNNLNMAASSWKDGQKIYFPTSTGLLGIIPEDLLGQEIKSKICIVNVQINGEPLYDVIPSTGQTSSNKYPLLLDLSHSKNNISFYISAPSAHLPEYFNFKYRILGVSDDWKSTDGKTKIELNGLGTGNYFVEVESMDVNDTSDSYVFPIRIRPPWYLSLAAKLIYLFTAGFVIFGIFKYDRNRLLLKHETEMLKQESNKNKAIYSFTNRFFAFLAHEFKTPLSIMAGINDELRDVLKNSKSVTLLDSAIQQSNQMVEILDEMIDMTRLNHGNFKIHYTSGNITDFVKKILVSFRPLTQLHQIDLVEKFPDEAIVMDFDQIRLRYVLNNLLSNALRFAPKNGKINVQMHKVYENKLIIKVADNGIGIHPDQLEKIFEPYFTTEIGFSIDSDQNFGLGLSFVKEIVTKMEGEVLVESQYGHGATFNIVLPIREQSFAKGMGEKSEPEAAEISQAEDNSEEKSLSVTKKPLLLLVDDNVSSLKNLENLLHNDYNLLLARNGREATDFIQSHSPDIIITDVLMPVMNGIELVKYVRNNKTTSHMPVIIVSGKSDLEDKLVAKTAGVDAFISKPFHPKELLVLIENICNLQNNWKNSTLPSTLMELKNTDVGQEQNSNDSQIDHKFIHQLYQIFEDNYPHDSFDIDEICQFLHISRAHLYRKIANISNQGVMELLRNYRLEKGYQLMLENPELSTKEIAFKVGFKERSHFSNLFSKKYGFPPSDMKKKNAPPTNGQTQ